MDEYKSIISQNSFINELLNNLYMNFNANFPGRYIYCEWITNLICFNCFKISPWSKTLFHISISVYALWTFQAFESVQNVLLVTNNKSGTYNYFTFLCFSSFFDHNLLHLLSYYELQIYVQMFHNIIYISFSIPCCNKCVLEDRIRLVSCHFEFVYK